MSESNEASPETRLLPNQAENRPSAAGTGATEEQEKHRPARRRTREGTAPTETPAAANKAAPSTASARQPASKSVADKATEDNDTEMAGESSIARAEAIMDQAGERVGALMMAVGQRVRRVASLAREEAEDIVAEAQNIRHGNGNSTNSR
jgi:hypothetical protein